VLWESVLVWPREALSLVSAIMDYLQHKATFSL
jgi:hypothetical protein